jgi:hypothetical protein
MTADEAATRVRDVADRLYSALYADEPGDAALIAEDPAQRAAEGAIARLVEAEEQFTFASGATSLTAGLTGLSNASEILASFLSTSAARGTDSLVQACSDARQELDELLAVGQRLQHAA